MRRNRGDAKAIMLVLMARPDGAGSAELQEVLEDDLQQVTGARLSRGMRNGWIFKPTIHVRPTHYFDCQAKADAWAKRVVKQPAAIARTPTPGVQCQADRPVRAYATVKQVGGVTYTTERAPPGRFEAAPGSFGAGFSAVGVGRSIDDGKAWA